MENQTSNRMIHWNVFFKWVKIEFIGMICRRLTEAKCTCHGAWQLLKEGD
jgi:hypothetical protein